MMPIINYNYMNLIKLAKKFEIKYADEIKRENVIQWLTALYAMTYNLGVLKNSSKFNSIFNENVTEFFTQDSYPLDIDEAIPTQYKKFLNEFAIKANKMKNNFLDVIENNFQGKLNEFNEFRSFMYSRLKYFSPIEAARFKSIIDKTYNMLLRTNFITRE